MTLPLVYVITVNWNRQYDTLQCIASLISSNYTNQKLLVVDNGSNDGSPEAIATYFPNVEQVISPRNLGFAGGYNLGFRHALNNNADFVFILNNDTIIAPNTLNLLVDATESPDVGIAAPIIYYTSKPNKIWSAGANRVKLTMELTRNHGRDQTYLTTIERDFLSGCAMLIKNSVIREIGLFDERFFIYYEDSDFCIRAKNAGYRLFLVPQAKVWHKVSQSSDGYNSPKERYWMARSSVLFYRKHAIGLKKLILIFYRLGSAIKTTILLSFMGKKDSMIAYWRGLFDGLLETSSEIDNENR